MKPKAYIFDIDGTLADCSHRLHHITGDTTNWDAFYAACFGDAVIKNVAEVFKALGDYEDNVLILLTGRSNRVYEETSDWIWVHFELSSYNGDVELFMRPDGDHRPDYVIKREIYEREIKEKYDVIGVFEDRQRCVDMWRALGLTCFQVAPGDY